MANFQCLITVLLITITSILSFDVNRKDNVVVYWGQNDDEKSLANYCNDKTYDVIVLSFLDYFFDSSMKVGDVSLPQLSIDYCSTYFSNYRNLKSCPSIAADIKTCQSKGKAILLSLGGSDGKVGFTSAAQAQQLANTIWQMYGGGKDTAYPRPFGTAILDGFDLDVESGSAKYYDSFVVKLRSLMNADSSKKYYIAGAPQCPYPDEWVGPGAGTALDAVQWDFISIQFYNNYCGVNHPSEFNYKTWANWAKSSTYNKNIKLLIGAPSSASAAGEGYVNIDALMALINTHKTDANFGGAMFWDAGHADKNIVCGTQNYIECVSTRMKASSPSPSPSPSSTTKSSTTKSSTTKSSTTKASTSSSSTTKSSTTKGSSTTKSLTTTTSGKLTGGGSTSDGKKSIVACSLGDGFYCTASSQYVWCVGSQHWIMGCGSGTVCNGKTKSSSNPCGFPQIGSPALPTGGSDDGDEFFTNPFTSNSTNNETETSLGGDNINGNIQASSDENAANSMPTKTVAIIAASVAAGVVLIAVLVVLLLVRHRRNKFRNEEVSEIGTTNSSSDFPQGS